MMVANSHGSAMMLTLILLSSLFFQEPQVDETLEVSYILVDVSVTDADGNPVLDLTKDDFVVNDGNKKREIQTFDILDLSGKAPESQEADPMEQTLIMVLDMGGLPMDAFNQTYDQLVTFFENLQPSAPLQLFIYSMDVGIVSKSFTPDPKQALADLAIFKENWKANFDTTKGLRAGLAEMEKFMSDCYGKSGYKVDRGTVNCINQNYRRFVTYQEQQTRAMLNGLSKIMMYLDRVPGLKSLYLVSPGFTRTPGQTANNVYRAYSKPGGATFSGGATDSVNPQAGVFSASHFKEDLILGHKSGDLDPDFNRMAHLSLATRTMIHTIQSGSKYFATRPKNETSTVTRKVNIEREYGNFVRELSSGLSELSAISGGAHREATDLATELNQTLEKSRHYYVLGFQNEDSRKAKFRRIKVKCKRDGVTLNYRKGYMTKGRKSK